MKPRLVIFTVLLVLLLLGIGEVSARQIYSVGAGAAEGAAHDDSFETTEDVYAMGDVDGAPGESLLTVLKADIYVTKDRTWTVGDNIVGVITKTPIVATGLGGSFNEKVWSKPLTIGDYDLVLDEDQNGKYDSYDVVYNKMTVGFNVIPEFQTIALPVLATLGLVFWISRRSRHSRRNK